VKTKINPLRISYLKKFLDRYIGKRVLIFSFHTASVNGGLSREPFPGLTTAKGVVETAD
jgi:hypothetical protein